ncbi:type II toxin-antitoxin system RelE/ParE family toxin [Litoribacter ruber]|uniref:type II toxin-antitoxin system RelE/ParE family toxin n=1 Tax=Litoribacter ruber TaxID=702568 RepID=UPI001BDAD417|nr:type II toxin-antitoxin system RelE/ParE family toxin [Litoribacter ruber]
MNFRLEFTGEARLDIQDFFNWYNLRKAGLGNDFVLCIESAINQILRDPMHCSPQFKDVRRKLVKRFPFHIVYILRDSLILIIGVFHTSRAPEAWVKRVKRMRD